MRKTLLVLVLLAGALAVAVTACGSDDESPSSAATATEEGEEELTADEASAEIDQIKQMLDEGLTQYRDGDKEGADTTIGDAYLEHFEKVEHPLEERDHELMEDLEHRISTEIRDKMKNDDPAAEIQALVDETRADLDTAKTKLAESE